MKCYVRFIHLIILLSSIQLTFGQESEKKNDFRGKKFFLDKSKLDDPFSLRDPFQRVSTELSNQDRKIVLYKKDDSTYSNKEEIDFEKISISSIKVIGVIVGKERRALIQLGEKSEILNFKEGAKIGRDQAELKAILPGGIVLVEKLTNVYGEEEYLETVIPISK